MKMLLWFLGALLIIFGLASYDAWNKNVRPYRKEWREIDDALRADLEEDKPALTGAAVA